MTVGADRGDAPPAPRAQRGLIALALAVWLVGALSLGAALMVLHAPLPLPRTARVPSTGRYMLVHALSLECPCSRRVLDALLARGAHADVDEKILLVGADETSAARARLRGFTVELLDEQRLAQRYGIEAVPLLLIVAPDGFVDYRGAHAPRPQMAPIDLVLLEEVRRGGRPRSLALFGCAVARDLQHRLDPLGLKYSWWR